MKELQTYALSVYPGEYAMVKVHPSDKAQLYYKKEDVDKAISEAHLTGKREGMTMAAGKLRRRLDNYAKEHGVYDDSTGETEYPGTGEEYVNDLQEQIEEIETARDAMKG